MKRKYSLLISGVFALVMETAETLTRCYHNTTVMLWEEKYL